jgi:hypothetical protein
MSQRRWRPNATAGNTQSMAYALAVVGKPRYGKIEL